jgi:hypothetical protein
MACEAIQTKLDGLVESRLETNHEMQQLGPQATAAERSALLQLIKSLNVQIASTKHDLDVCLHTPPGVSPPVAPQEILQINHTNPAFAFTGDWAKTIAGGKFPLHSDQEWKQVLAPKEDHEVGLVGASGWVIDPGPSHTDVPFDHPLLPDWEFGLAPDVQYQPLIAEGNKPANTFPGSEEEASQVHARALGINADSGLLGVEIDTGIVPVSFQQQVKPGSRAAVLGRWIVDCGHTFKNDTFRSEIHPPLFMACANLQTEADGSIGTRVVFTSRPYLVSQKFTKNPGDMYRDDVPDDGFFTPHMLRELRNANTFQSKLVEAHPKVKSHPFVGKQVAHFVVKPPPIHGVHAGGGPVRRLQVSFQFTVRSGCAVQVISTAPDTIDVLVVLTEAGYTPPPLPNKRDRLWSNDELAKLDAAAGTGIFGVQALSNLFHQLTGDALGALVAGVVLSRGIQTTELDPLPEVNVLDASSAVSVFADTLPAGQGVVLNNHQPYPFFGWMDVHWVIPAVVNQPVLSP